MNDCCLPSSQKLLVGALSRMFHLLREQNLAAPGNVGKKKDARWKNGQILGAYAWPIWSIPGLEPTTLARPTFPALLYSRLGACNGPASLFSASYPVNQGEFRSQQPKAKMKLYKVQLNNSRMGLF